MQEGYPGRTPAHRTMVRSATPDRGNQALRPGCPTTAWGIHFS